MTRYKDLFVDFDDTIYDTHGNAILALQELFSDYHLERYFEKVEDFTIPYWQANQELWALYTAEKIERDYLIVERFRRPLACGHGLNPTEAFCREVGDHFLDLCGVKPGLVEGARELLDYLQPRYRMHLCSNGFHEVQYRKLEASDTLRYFNTVILSEDAGYNKPSARYFDYAYQVSGARPETTLMIGDNLQTDILGARKAGLDQLYFNPKETPTEEKITFMVHSLREIMEIL